MYFYNAVRNYLSHQNNIFMRDVYFSNVNNFSSPGCQSSSYKNAHVKLHYFNVVNVATCNP